MTSKARAIVDDPNFCESSFIILGFLTAAVLSVTLSAPALRTDCMSSKFLKPPPTVIGMKISFTVFEIIFKC